MAWAQHQWMIGEAQTQTRFFPHARDEAVPPPNPADERPATGVFLYRIQLELDDFLIELHSSPGGSAFAFRPQGARPLPAARRRFGSKPPVGSPNSLSLGLSLLPG
jgi:hypothetical protein